MALVCLGFIFLAKFVSLTTTLELTTYQCNEDEGPFYIGPHYTVVDSSHSSVPCRIQSDLSLPIATNVTYVVEVELLSVRGSVPTLIININDGENYEMLSFSTDVGWSVELVSMIDGLPVPSEEFYGSSLPGHTWFHVHMTVHSDSVLIRLNNEQNITIPLSSERTPSVGLMQAMEYKSDCQSLCEYQFRNLKLIPDTTPQLYRDEFGRLTATGYSKNRLYVQTLEFHQLGHIHASHCFVALYFKQINEENGTIFIQNDASFHVGSVKMYSTTAEKLDVYFYTTHIVLGYTIDYHVFACGVQSSDLSFVCEEGQNHNLPADFYRSISYTTEFTNSDANLPMGWYRFTSCAGNTIYTAIPSSEGVCGTQHPIWLQEPANGIDKSGLSEATACIYTDADECTNSWTLPVYGCDLGSYNVYYLLPTTPTSGYCVGTRLQCDASKNLTSNDGCDPCTEGDFPIFTEPPTFSTWEPDATLPGAFRLSCEVPDPEGRTNDTEYDFRWYYGNRISLTHGNHSDKPSVTYLSSTQLRKEHLQNNIVCEARGQYKIRKQWGPWKQSTPLFIGIQVLDEEYLINPKVSKSINFIITVPFSCDGDNCMAVEDPECYTEVFSVWDTTPLNPLYHCTNGLYREPVMINQNSCSEVVKCSEWGTTIRKHSIKQKDTTTDKIHSQTLFLVLKDKRDMWNNVLTDTTIHLSANLGKSITSRNCTSNNDPHITTFARVMYDVHTKGEYVLYKSVPYADRDMDVLVTAYFEACPGTPHIMCNRALGVRVQEEVVIINPTAQPRTYCYYGPGRGAEGFKVTQLDSFTKFKIYLPRGEVVTAIFTWGNEWLNIAIRGNLEAQRFETSKGNGLCGRVDGADFDFDLYYRNGDRAKNITRKWEPITAFPSDWEVQTGEDIISSPEYDNDINSTLDIWYSCAVDKLNLFLQTDNWDFKTDVIAEDCKPFSNDNMMNELREDSDLRCRKGTTSMFSNVAKQFDNPTIQQKSEISKSEWTEETARDYCLSYIAESSTGKACNTVEPQDVDKAVEECAVDILLTGSTDWAVATLASLQDACIESIYTNIRLWVSNETNGNDTIITPPTALIDNLCPSDCSGNGVCVESVCVCNNGFVGFDCSLSVEKPPELHGIYEGAICYAATCSSASILGNGFVNGDELTCHYMTEDTIVPVNGNMVSHNLISCPLPASVFSTSGFIKYSLLVSNDGEHTGEALGLVFVNSPCVSCDDTSGAEVNCNVKNNMCLIEGKCVPSGEVSSDDVCSFCNPGANQDSWSLQQGCGETDGDARLQPFQIGLIAVGSIFVAFGLIIGSIVITKRSQRKITPTEATVVKTNVVEPAPLPENNTTC